jgi:hypothetical protein
MRGALSCHPAAGGCSTHVKLDERRGTIRGRLSLIHIE